MTDQLGNRDRTALMLRSVSPFDALEAGDIADILAWLNATPDIYRRVKPNVPSKHLAVYCVPVDASARRVFLGFHLGARRWLPPGGHVDIDEDPHDAALRECKEELGVTPALFFDAPVLATVETTVGADAHTDVTLWFAFNCSAQDDLALTEDEFSARRWFSFAETVDLDTNPNLGRFLMKFREHVSLLCGHEAV